MENNTYVLKMHTSIAAGCYILATAWRLIEHQQLGLLWFGIGIIVFIFD